MNSINISYAWASSLLIKNGRILETALIFFDVLSSPWPFAHMSAHESPRIYMNIWTFLAAS